MLQDDILQRDLQKLGAAFPPGNRDTLLRQFVMWLWICGSNFQRQVPGIWHPYYSTTRGCLFPSMYSSSTLQNCNKFNYWFLTLGTLLLFISVYTGLNWFVNGKLVNLSTGAFGLQVSMIFLLLISIINGSGLDLLFTQESICSLVWSIGLRSGEETATTSSFFHIIWKWFRRLDVRQTSLDLPKYLYSFNLQTYSL